MEECHSCGARGEGFYGEEGSPFEYVCGDCAFLADCVYRSIFRGWFVLARDEASRTQVVVHSGAGRFADDRNKPLGDRADGFRDIVPCEGMTAPCYLDLIPPPGFEMLDKGEVENAPPEIRATLLNAWADVHDGVREAVDQCAQKRAENGMVGEFREIDLED